MIKEMDFFAQRAGVLSPGQIQSLRINFEALQTRRAARGLGLGAHGEQRKERLEMATDDDYRRFYQSRAGDLPFVDISPSYCRMPAEAFRHMARVFPQTKVVLLIRDRADHLWSRINHRRKTRSLDLRAIEIFRSLRDDYLTGRGDPDSYHPENWVYLVNNHPSTVHARLSQAFDPADILVLFTEDLFSPDAQQATLDRLCAFAGIAPCPIDAFEFSANRGEYDPIPDEVREFAVAQLGSEYHWARRHMGRLPERWHDTFRQITGNRVPD